MEFVRLSLFQSATVSGPYSHNRQSNNAMLILPVLSPGEDVNAVYMAVSAS